MTEQTPQRDLLEHLPELAQYTKQTSRRRAWIGVIALGVLLVLVVVGYLVYQLIPLDAPIPAHLGAEYAGLERGYTDQGYPRLGRPDAPVVVEEFASYACPHCRDFHDTLFPSLLPEIAAGDVQFVLIPVPQIGIGAGTAAKAAYCAGEQGKYWEMNDVLFDWQKRFVAMTFNGRRLSKGAKNMGLDTAAFDQCMSDNHPKTVIDAAKNEFNRRALSGTPTFFINGQQVHNYREFDNLGQLAEQLRKNPS